MRVYSLFLASQALFEQVCIRCLICATTAYLNWLCRSPSTQPLLAQPHCPGIVRPNQSE